VAGQGGDDGVGLGVEGGGQVLGVFGVAGGETAAHAGI
jgi:hypothetical protein